MNEDDGSRAGGGGEGGGSSDSGLSHLGSLILYSVVIYPTVNYLLSKERTYKRWIGILFAILFLVLVATTQVVLL